MKKQIKDIDVTFISLVRKGANKKIIIFKSDDDNKDLIDIPIKKFDLEKGIVYGIVYSPDEEDTQGDYAKATEIEKASQNFMRNLSIHNVDKQHSFQKEDAFVVESWIVEKGKDKVFSDEKTGSWAVGIKLENDDLKKEAKDGTLTGLSMAGTATRVTETQKSDEGLIGKIEGMIKSLISKKEIDMTKEEIQGMIDVAITKAVEALPKTKTIEETAGLFKTVLDKLEITKDLKEAKESIEKMSKETPGSIQTEITKDDLQKQDEEGEKMAEIIKSLQGDGKE